MNKVSKTRWIVGLVALMLYIGGSLSAQQTPKLIVQNGHTNAVNDLEFSPDNKFLASAGKDKIIVIWDVAAGKEFQRLEGHATVVQAVSFSNDGQMLASVGFDSSLIIWNYMTGTILKTFVLPEKQLNEISFSPDGKFIYCCAVGVYKINIDNGRIEKLGLAPKSMFTAIKCDPTGKYIAVGGKSESKVYVYDLANNQMLCKFKGRVNDLYFDGKGILTGAGSLGTLYKWDIYHQGFLHRFSIDADRLYNQYYSVTMNDTFFAGGNRNGLIYVYNLKNAKKKFTLNGHFNPVRAIALNSSGTILASAGDDNYIAIWNFENGELVRLLSGSGRKLQALSDTYDKQGLIAGYSDGSVASINLNFEKNAVTHQFTYSPSKVRKGFSYSVVSIVPKDSVHTKLLVLSHKRTTKDAEAYKRQYYYIADWDIKTGKVVKNHKVGKHNLNELYQEFGVKMNKHQAINFKGDFVDTGKVSNNNIQEYHQRFAYDFDEFNSLKKIVWLGDFGYAITGSSDGKISLWNKATEQRVASLYLMGSGGYVVLDTTGYYMASKSNLDYLSFTFANKVYPFDQFDLQYNRPDIVSSKLLNLSAAQKATYEMAYTKRLRNITTSYNAKSVISIPIVTVAEKDRSKNNTTEKAFTIHADIRDSLYRLSSVDVNINNVPVFGKRGQALKGDSTQAHVELLVELMEGDNIIEVTSVNEQGYKSLAAPFHIYCDSKTNHVSTTYFIGFGVNDYIDTSVKKLHYAINDINSLAKELGKHNKHLVVDTFFNQSVKLSALQSIKQLLMKTTVDDKVIMLLSGHGMADSLRNFYFGTRDMDFKNPSGKGISYNDLDTLLDGIPARRKLLMIDACQSGGADKDTAVSKKTVAEPFNAIADNGDGKKGHAAVSPRQIADNRSFETMQQLFADLSTTNGAIVISAALAIQSAIENNGNGVFTRCLVEGLHNKHADFNKDNVITVTELKRYVEEEVDKATHQQQRPTSRQENLSFDWQVK